MTYGIEVSHETVFTVKETTFPVSFDTEHVVASYDLGRSKEKMAAEFIITIME